MTPAPDRALLVKRTFESDTDSGKNEPVTDATETLSTPLLVLGRIMAGHLHMVGSFQFRFIDQHWEWSDEVARLHGYRQARSTHHRTPAFAQTLRRSRRGRRDAGRVGPGGHGVL